MNNLLEKKVLTLVFEYITTKDKDKREESMEFLKQLASKYNIPLKKCNRKKLNEAYIDFINKPFKDSIPVLYFSL